MSNYKDLLGQRFGRLLVTNRSEKKNTNRVIMWECLCDCGNTTVVRGTCLRFGQPVSCGCLQKEASKKTGYANTTHGQSRNKKPSKAYAIWCAIKRRCYNPASPYFRHYGGRGIEMCEEWKNSFESFYQDMGDPPDEMSLDRIDNNGNYNPMNCRWATRIEQARNKSSTLLITYKGETKPLIEWAQLKGIVYETLIRRIKNGWPIESALESPVRQHKPYKKSL